MIIKLALASLRVRLAASSFLVLAIALVFLAVLLVQGAMEFQAQQALAATRFVSPADAVIERMEFDPAIVQRIYNLDGIDNVEVALASKASILGQSVYIGGIPIPSNVFNLRENLIEGTMPTEPTDILIRETTATELGVDVGDRLSVGMTRGDEPDVEAFEITATVVGILRDKSLTPEIPVMSVTTLRDLTGRYPDRAMLFFKPGVEFEEVENALRELLPPTARIRTYEATYEEAQSQRSQADIILIRYNLLLVASMGFLIWTLASISLRSRSQELGGLITVGVPAGTLFAAGILEIVVLTILGGALAIGFLPLALRMLAARKLFLSVTAGPVVEALVLVVVCAMASWLLPLWSLMRRPPRSMLTS